MLQYDRDLKRDVRSERGADQQISAEALSTHLVTVEIFTPNTPMGFLEGILFRLNSRLVNFMEILTSI